MEVIGIERSKGRQGGHPLLTVLYMAGNLHERNGHGEMERFISYEVLEFHIEPRKPLAEDTMSTARPTKPGWSSAAERGTRSLNRGIGTGLVLPVFAARSSDTGGDGSLPSGTDEEAASPEDGTIGLNAVTGELAGVGCRERCSSSSGMGDGKSAVFSDTRVRGTVIWFSYRGCRNVAMLAVDVDEPDTDEGGDGTSDLSGCTSTRLDERDGDSTSAACALGEPNGFGGLTLAVSGLPVRSRPRSSSLPILMPLLSRSRSRPRTCAAPSPSAEPVGERLPIGEFVPRLERDPDRSRSEYDPLRVTERPRESDRESVERV